MIESSLIVEIKALKGLDNSHLAQVIGYLAVTGFKIGLLINFGECSLVYRRILPPKDITVHEFNRQWLFVPDWLRSDGRSRLMESVIIRSIRTRNPLSADIFDRACLIPYWTLLTSIALDKIHRRTK